jgi:Circadian oscillating protein COP23
MIKIATSWYLSTIFTIGILAAGVQSSLADRQESATQVRFYCGQSFDRSNHKMLPTTFAATSKRKDPVAVITWKIGFAGYSPQNRCNLVSAKFQTAWAGGKLHYLRAGTSSATGQGIICGVASPEQACDGSSMLFTLKNAKQAQDIIASIEQIRRGTNSEPIPQGSGDGLVDLENLLK